MKERRLKKEVKYVLYGVSFALVIGALFLLTNSLTYKEYKDDPKYVSDTIFDDSVPVVSTSAQIIRPYTDKELSIVKSYYDYQAEVKDQLNSIIEHDNTFMQNSGASYGGKDNFDVVSILDGTVSKVDDNELLGKIVEITHENNIVSIYQSLGEVTVKKDDVVKQGTVIGKSGTSNISTDLGSHLHFELVINGNIVNPENYYDKLLNDIKEQ